MRGGGGDARAPRTLFAIENSGSVLTTLALAATALLMKRAWTTHLRAGTTTRGLEVVKRECEKSRALIIVGGESKEGGKVKEDSGGVL